MKTIRYLAFSCLILLSFNANSQNTTQEELNFMTRGFQQLIESGLDMKKGYSLRDTTSYTTVSGRYDFHFLNLIRDRDRSYAGTIVIADSKQYNKRYYLGLIAAAPNGEIDHERTLNVQMQNYAWDQNIRTAFLQALSEYLCSKITREYSAKR